MFLLCALRALCRECICASKRHPLSPHWARFCPKQGYKKTVIITAHRLARILLAMWRKGDDFVASKLNVVPEQGVYRKTYYWRMKGPEKQVVVA